MDSRLGVLDKIRSLVAHLSVEERLAVIQAIAAMDSEVFPSDSSAVERRSQLDTEQSAWFARQLSERQRYHGEFVAVHGGQVVDHDPDQRTLYLRIRQRFGHRPVLIVHADWAEPPVYSIHSPHMEQQ